MEEGAQMGKTLNVARKDTLQTSSVQANDICMQAQRTDRAIHQL